MFLETNQKVSILTDEEQENGTDISPALIARVLEERQKEVDSGAEEIFADPKRADKGTQTTPCACSSDSNPSTSNNIYCLCVIHCDSFSRPSQTVPCSIQGRPRRRPTVARSDRHHIKKLQVLLDLGDTQAGSWYFVENLIILIVTSLAVLKRKRSSFCGLP